MIIKYVVIVLFLIGFLLNRIYWERKKYLLVKRNDASRELVERLTSFSLYRLFIDVAIAVLSGIVCLLILKIPVPNVIEAPTADTLAFVCELLIIGLYVFSSHYYKKRWPLLKSNENAQNDTWICTFDCVFPFFLFLELFTFAELATR